MSGPAARLTKCPRDGCERLPLPIFCPQDWMLVSGPTRAALIKQWKTLSGKATKAPPKRFVALLTEAVREIAKVTA